ncbi:coiled-coil domain-containing protein 22-like [Schistocerca gregaria]|uniref:coiled-coil domain-containing protein 22-like n=1 Tax=Schistocerca gregaria TaxID=7010 RepID=UPI00211E2A59|nr:coiled-coil domain-containing protein 22-like [Schistocerca gregaria]
MEEIDEVMLQDLRNIGCEIGESVCTCKDIKTELPACMLKCLRLADKQQRCPNRLSKNITKKVNQITRLINRVKELGFPYEFSYHQVLYPSEQNARVLLTWLRNLVLKDGECPSRTSATRREMSERMESLKGGMWVPCFEVEEAGFPCVEELSTHKLHVPFGELEGRETAWECWRGLKEQVSEKGGLAPSVFEHNTRLLCDQQDGSLQGSGEGRRIVGGEEWRRRLSAMSKMSASRENETVDGRNCTRFARRLAYGGRSRGLIRTVRSGSEHEKDESFSGSNEKAAAEYADDVPSEKKCEETEILAFLKPFKGEELESVCAELERIACMLSDGASDPISALEGKIHEKKVQLRQAAESWENSRLGFIERYREARALASQQESVRLEKEEHADQLRGSVRSLTQKLAELDREMSNLSRMYESSSKSSREVYIACIMNLLKSIERQNLELFKNAEHLLEVKREVNGLMEMIQRSYFSAEEKILVEIKKKSRAKLIYDELRALDRLFDQLIELSEKNGRLKREGLELEERYSELRARLGQIDLEAIKRDLELAKRENEEQVMQKVTV